MADNVKAEPVSSSSGVTFATDDVGGAHWPYAKLAFGADNTANRVASTDPLPVVTTGSSISVSSFPTEAHSEDYDSSTGGTDTTLAFGVALPSTSGAVAGGTTANPVATKGTGTFTISGTVHGSSVSVSGGSVDASGSTVSAGGLAAAGAAVAGNPVAIGFRANLNEPSEVDDGDAVWGWADRFGRPVVIDGHSNPEDPKTVNITSSGASTIVGAPGASLSLYVKTVSVSNASTSSIEIDLRPDSTNPVWKANLAGGGGGFANISFGSRGWRVGANRSLRANLPSGGGDVHVNVQEYYIAAT